LSAPARFAFTGDAPARERIVAALHRVIDPEMSLDIVELGLVYGVHAQGDDLKVRLTMTSPACPVAELIVDDVVGELKRALGAQVRVDVDLVWEPPWEPTFMSDKAQAVMGWD
jgi:metal-sulfur cluster biosynthetic enzyme